MPTLRIAPAARPGKLKFSYSPLLLDRYPVDDPVAHEPCTSLHASLATCGPTQISLFAILYINTYVPACLSLRPSRSPSHLFVGCTNGYVHVLDPAFQLTCSFQAHSYRVFNIVYLQVS